MRKRVDARKYLISFIPPEDGTGIQYKRRRIHPYIVWNHFEIEQFVYNVDDAYFVLQEVLDELRTGLDWDEPDDEDEDF